MITVTKHWPCFLKQQMKRLCGFFLFCVAIGMLIGLFIPGAVVQTVVILLLLLIGYNLFVC